MNKLKNLKNHMKPVPQLIIGVLLLTITMLIGYVMYTNTTLEVLPLFFYIRVIQYIFAITAGYLIGKSISEMVMVKTHNYTIEFVEWLDVNKQRLNYSQIHTTKELLEIFKKENGK